MVLPWYYKIMRDIKYKNRQFRLSEEVYLYLLKLKRDSGKSWNLVFINLKEKNEQRIKKTTR